MAKFFAIAALLFSLVAYVPYVKAIILEGKRPKRSSWITFFIVNTVVLLGMVKDHHVAWPNVAYEIGMAVVLVFAFTKGESGWTASDKRVLSIALLGAAAYFFVNPLTALVVSLAAALIGTVPIWQALWDDPDFEKRSPWVLWLCGSLCEFVTLGSFDSWTIAAAIGPVVYFGQQLSVLLLGLRPVERVPA